MILLFLTCANKTEAEKIAKTLLDKKLIICAKITDRINSHFLWKGITENAEETLLMMDSHESKFDDIEKTVKELHSYELFNLTALNITQMSRGVKNWLEEDLKI